MADCYYHGPSGAGPCKECEEEREKNLERGSISVGRDIMEAQMQIKENELKEKKTPVKEQKKQ